MSIKEIIITQKSVFSNGKTFDETGTYDLIEGKAFFEINPSHKSNVSITDIDLAPVNKNGNVEFSSDFALLKPSNPQKGNDVLLLDIVNRGNKTALVGFNNISKQNDPNTLSDTGNDFLMNHGYSILFCGWQADVPENMGLIKLDVPEAMVNGKQLIGKIMNQYQTNEKIKVLPLADRYHLKNPSYDPQEAIAQMTVRDHPTGNYEIIPRENWSFIRVEDPEIEPDHSHIHLETGFEPGRIYQLIYTSIGSRIVGLGFAAVRDISTFLKYESSDYLNPCAGNIDTVISYGISQSGRFLREYIYNDMNIDENGSKALDGIIAHVGGGMRGEFNLRFGQPSKDVCYITPELFPFSDITQQDPLTKTESGLLDKMNKNISMPKIMFTNSSAEYWRGDAALIHTNINEEKDVVSNSNIRIYHFAGTQHGSGIYPAIKIRPSDLIEGNMPFNTVNYTPLLRSCLENMKDWIKTDIAPADSCHPTHIDSTAVESKFVLQKFASIPNIKLPDHTLNVIGLDYGNEKHLGRTIKLPPEHIGTYPAYVSDVDETLNEKKGIRLPDISVPTATNTGWNCRNQSIGNDGLLIGITGGLAGSTFQLPVTNQQANEVGDIRPSIESLYTSKHEYINKVTEAVKILLTDRYILEEDAEEIIYLAELRYDDLVNAND